MNATGCLGIRLSEFIDGELNGVERLAVAEHLSQCQACTSEVDVLRELGERLRLESPADSVDRLEGLAGGVIARIRAERAQSWRAMFDRAVDGWHWLLVGSSAVGAAVATALILSALIQFGPAPSRGDSIAGMMTTPPTAVLSSGEGAIYITSAADPDSASARRSHLVMYANLLAPDGRPRDPGSLSPGEWKLLNSLVVQIKQDLVPARARYLQPMASRESPPVTPAEVSIRFVTTTGVSAKGL